MYSFPRTKDEKKDAAEMNGQPWMFEVLKLNPSYCGWDIGDDYMKGEGKNGSGWDSGQRRKTWAEFESDWHLDELNELVNFFFAVRRASKQCEACEGMGINKESLKVSNDFYDFDETGTRWCDKITEDELKALIKEKRIRADDTGRFPTLEEVNRVNAHGGAGWGSGMHHDAINRWILIERRCKRLKIWGKCQACEGKSYIYTEPEAKLSLTMWILHPRKGASRGVEVKDIKEDELQRVFLYLKNAAERNRDRFSKVVSASRKRSRETKPEIGV